MIMAMRIVLNKFPGCASPYCPGLYVCLGGCLLSGFEVDLCLGAFCIAGELLLAIPRPGSTVKTDTRTTRT